MKNSFKTTAKAVAKKVKNFVTDPRCLSLMVMMLVCASPAFAGLEDGIKNGQDAINTTSGALVKYIPYVTKLCYAIAGIVAITGAISVYIKMNNEEQDVKKSIMMIVGACIFLIAAAQCLPLFFDIEVNGTDANFKSTAELIKNASYLMAA